LAGEEAWVVKRAWFAGAALLGGYLLVACGSAGGGGGGTGTAVCGDGFRSGNEICDGSDLGGMTCATLGFKGGTPSCTATCAFDAGTCCNDSCVNVGDTTCSGDKVQTCLPQQNGCRQFADTVDCAQSAQQCAVNNSGTAACNAGCVDACPTLNATQCNAGVVETCQAGTDGCRDWVATTDCKLQGKACDATGGTAQCSGSCADQCTTDGETSCSGNVLQTCSQGQDGCFTLSTTQDCANAGQQCKTVSGTAQCSSSCANKCATAGLQGCNGTVLQTCTADSNGCLDWAVTEDCSTKQQFCKLAGAGTAKCEGVCTNPCPTLGAKKCNANAIEECKIAVNACQEWQATTTCPLGEACKDNGGTYSCQTAPATGEDCGTVIPIKAGKNTINWTATSKDHLITAPSPCVSTSYTIQGPDVVLVYQSTFTGNVEFTVSKTANNRIVAVAAGGSCGSLANQLACVSDYSSTSMGGSFNVSSGSNYFFYIADTSNGAGTLDNPFDITLAEIDCSVFKASAVTMNPPNAGTTSTLAPKLSIDFDVPLVTTSSTGTVKLTGNKGTNLTYTVGSSTQLTWTNANKTLNINPGQTLPAGEVISVSLDNFLDAKCNKPINKPTWSFTVITPPCQPGQGGMLGTTKTLVGATPTSATIYYTAVDQAANGYVYYGGTTDLWRKSKTTAAEDLLTSDDSKLGYGMVVNGADPFTIEYKPPSANLSGYLFKLVPPTSGTAWSAIDFMQYPASPTPASSYARAGTQYKGKIYVLNGATSTTSTTEIWSVSASGTPLVAATLEASFTGEAYCTGMAADDKYFYVACGTSERLIRVDRTTKAVSLITDGFDLYTTVNGVEPHDTNNDGTADFLYFRGARAEVYYVCNPAGSQPYADTLATFGTSTVSYTGLAFDAVAKKLYAVDNTTDQLWSVQ